MPSTHAGSTIVVNRHPSRGAALATLAAAMGATGLPAVAVPPLPLLTTSPASRLGTVLVLSGGGTRGAYEAGVVEALVQNAGVRDGQPLPDVDVVVGTSVGAITAWYVATAQYTALRNAWRTISAANIFRLKRRYGAMAAPSAGVVTRLVETLSLLANLTKTMDGVLDAGPIKAWLRANIDPERPYVVPLVFNAADIVNQRSAYFYAASAPAGDRQQAALRRSLEQISSIPSVVEPAHAILHDALYASVALPVLCDPIELQLAGVRGLFVDGGSADNTAIDVARVLGSRVNVVLVDPPTASLVASNSLEAGLGSFALLQRHVLESSLRAAYDTTLIKRTFATAHVDAAQRALLDGLYDVDLGILRPNVDLPGDIADFTDAQRLTALYDRGVTDAAAGWLAYVPTT